MINCKIVQKNNGFGLLELVVVIGVMAIVAAIATPGILSWRAKAELRSVSEDLRRAMKLAKSRAVREAKPVVANLETDSYSIFVDAGDGSGGPPNWQRDPGEPIVYERQLPKGIQLKPNVTATGTPAPAPAAAAPGTAIHNVCADMLQMTVESGTFDIAGNLLTIDDFEPEKAQFILTGLAPNNWRVWYDGVATNRIFIINEVYPDQLVFDHKGWCLNPQFLMIVNVNGQKILIEITRFGIGKVTKIE